MASGRCVSVHVKACARMSLWCAGLDCVPRCLLKGVESVSECVKVSNHKTVVCTSVAGHEVNM